MPNEDVKKVLRWGLGDVPGMKVPQKQMPFVAFMEWAVERYEMFGKRLEDEEFAEFTVDWE
eukprot:7051100-Lingulodinium_polyedra.AAC.1